MELNTKKQKAGLKLVTTAMVVVLTTSKGCRSKSFTICNHLNNTQGIAP